MSGFFGVASKENCVLDVFFGVDYHSHLGTRRGGMAIHGEKGFARAIHNIENSPFRTKFEKDIEEFDGNLGIGCISDNEAQPLLVKSHLGSFAITTVGRINNLEELQSLCFERGVTHFLEMSTGEVNPTELIASLINHKATIVEGLQYVQSLVKGSMSILLMTQYGIYAARDLLGRTPIVLGEKETGFCATFESSAFLNLGYHHYRDLGAGEIVFITPERIEVLQKPKDKMKICSFLWVYYGYPVCEYEGKNVDRMRFECGCEMGEKDDVEADFVSAIPDSGIGMALGYSEGKKIPYKRGIVKYTPTWPRSFTPPTQELRELVAKMKLIPNPDLINGKRVVFCDDSIVRGTQLRDNVCDLFRCGAKEVHMRISCPPLVYPCRFVNFTASKSELELITRRVIQQFEGDHTKNLEAYTKTDSPEYKRMVEEIRRQLKITSLKFNPLETMVKAIGLPKECICTHCFDGSSYE